MRTPSDVFEFMCPDHDQIWTYDGTRWCCIRKSSEGIRYRESGIVPLPVEEMAAMTGLTWIYFCTLTGLVEPLISKEQRNALVASRSPEQIEREAIRVAEMEDDRKQQVECLIGHSFDPLGRLMTEAITTSSWEDSN